MTVALRHQEPLPDFLLQRLVTEALEADLGERLSQFAESEIPVVEEGADVVLLECGAPSDDLDGWERACRTRIRGAATPGALVLLYSRADGWRGAGDEVRRVVRSVSPHPVRFLNGTDRDRRTVEADLLGALLTHRAPLRDQLLTAVDTHATDLLSWPRTLEDGTFIDRPEVERLERGVDATTSTTRFLIGPPGSGKSALLAEIGWRARDRGMPTVGVKADVLGRDISDDEALGPACGVPFALSTVVNALRLGGPVVVLVDQLDAVSALLDVYTSRLDTLLGFIGRVSGRTGVHVVASTRPFERAYDARLRSLDAEEIDLGVLPAMEVEAALRANGLDRLVPMAREIEAPWVLDLIVRHPPPAGASLSLTGALQHFWNVVVERPADPERSRVVRELAAQIANEEVFWVDEATLCAVSQVAPPVVDALVTDGMLVRFLGRPTSLGFRHQTLYAYSLARTLASDEVSLSEHVLDAKREGLFVRQTLLAGLAALREEGGPGYVRELGRLLDGVTRSHLRALLIRWLGSQAEPTDWERDRIISLLESDEGPRMLAALLASPASIRWLAQEGAFLRWVTGEPDDAELATPFLKAAVAGYRDEVRAILQEYWGAPEYDRLTDDVLSSLEQYNAEDIGVVIRLVERGTAFRSTIGLHKKTAPNNVFQVLGVEVDRALAAAEVAAAAEEAAQPGPVRAWWGRVREAISVRWEQATTWIRERRVPSTETVRLGRIRYDLIGLGHSVPSFADALGQLGDDWRLPELAELVRAHPAAFLRELWPRALRVLDALSHRGGVERVEYEQRFTITRPHYHSENRLIDLLFEAIEALVVADPGAFLAFLGEHEGHPAHLPHALIARGLAVGGVPVASAAATYLTGDPRRLSLGDLEDGHRYTKEAMQTVFEVGDPGEQYAVETALVGFRMYPRPVPGDNPSERRRRLHAERRHRLRRFRAVPPERRSARVRRLIQEGERRFPGIPDWDVSFSGVHAVGPRVGTEAMDDMSDDDLLALFDEYDDSTDWDRPRTRRAGYDSGGVIEQSRAFRSLALRAPERVTALLPRLTPERHDAYAAQALDGLVEGGMGPIEATRWAVELDRRGFQSDEFRDRVASTLGTAAERSGLPDEGITLLRRWLDECPQPEPDAIPGGQNLPTQPSVHPASFGVGGFGGVIPHGRGYMMGALLRGLLDRASPDYDTALELLESRLPAGNSVANGQGRGFETSLAVWGHTLTHAVRTLNGDRERATRVFDRVLTAFPDVWRLPLTPHIIAAAMGAFTPDETVDKWLRALAQSPYPYLRQVYGELLFIARATRDRAPWIEEARTLADGGDLTSLRGLALASAEGWRAQHVRDDAARVLAAAVRRSPAPAPAPRPAGSTEEMPRVWDGVKRVLWREKRFDPLSGEATFVLDALAERPDVGVRVAEHLVPYLERLVGPDGAGEDRARAARLAVGLAREAASLGPKDADAWAVRRALGDLTSLALTLHRAGDETLREAGVSLFEAILEVDPHSAQGAQRVLDTGVDAGTLQPRGRGSTQPPLEF